MSRKVDAAPARDPRLFPPARPQTQAGCQGDARASGGPKQAAGQQRSDHAGRDGARDALARSVLGLVLALFCRGGCVLCALRLAGLRGRPLLVRYLRLVCRPAPCPLPSLHRPCRPDKTQEPDQAQTGPTHLSRHHARHDRCVVGPPLAVLARRLLVRASPWHPACVVCGRAGGAGDRGPALISPSRGKRKKEDQK